MTVVIKDEAATIAAIDRLLSRGVGTPGSNLLDALLLLGVVAQPPKFLSGQKARMNATGNIVTIRGCHVAGHHGDPSYFLGALGWIQESELSPVEDDVEESPDWALHRALGVWPETNRSADAIINFIKQQGFVIKKKE